MSEMSSLVAGGGGLRPLSDRLSGPGGDLFPSNKEEGVEIALSKGNNPNRAYLDSG